MSGQRMSIKVPKSEKIFYIVSMFFVWLFTLLCIYPIWYVLVGSMSSGVHAHYAYFWPKGFSLTTYEQLFSRNDIWLAFVISIARTVVGTSLCVFFTSLLAYLVTQKSMYFRKAIYRYFIITMYINGGMIPWYITMKTFGLVNNFLVYVVPGIISVFNLILTKTFIESLPQSLEESAQLDGAGFFTIFIKIIMPLIKPILATVAVFTAVGQWNTWLDNYILVNRKTLTTLQLILYNYLNQAQQLANQMRGNGGGGGGAAIHYSVSADSVRMTMVIVTVIPIMLVYPFVQKYFTKGILLGSVKG
jgi:ABC-type glycerol-3-phosphate transport system permease component